MPSSAERWSGAGGGALLRGWPGGIDAATLDRHLRELVLADTP
ncbi:MULTISPECIES: hypothetical protein [Micromonospora]|nr:hypothetical protein [Micromonospora yangpuensis]